eukprot:Gb_39175 [translate_table: standard]
MVTAPHLQIMIQEYDVPRHHEEYRAFSVDHPLYQAMDRFELAIYLLIPPVYYELSSLAYAIEMVVMDPDKLSITDRAIHEVSGLPEDGLEVAVAGKQNCKTIAEELCISFFICCHIWDMGRRVQGREFVMGNSLSQPFVGKSESIMSTYTTLGHIATSLAKEKVSIASFANVLTWLQKHSRLRRKLRRKLRRRYRQSEKKKRKTEEVIENMVTGQDLASVEEEVRRKKGKARVVEVREQSPNTSPPKATATTTRDRCG